MGRARPGRPGRASTYSHWPLAFRSPISRGELVAADARRGVFVPGCRPRRRATLTQQQVTGLVAEGVIDAPEAVQIEEAHLAAVTAGVGQDALDGGRRTGRDWGGR